MKRILFIINILLATAALQAQGHTVYDSAWREDVKTVQLYRAGSPLDFPILVMGQDNAVLEFDILAAEAEVLQWRIMHCDRHWVPDGLEPNDFMSGFAEGTMEEHDFSFTTRRDYVHYRTALLGDFAEFTHSGNYAVEVTDRDGTVLLTRGFCVTEQAVKASAEVTRPYDGVDLDQRQEVDVRVESGERRAERTPDYLHVVVVQNGRLDNRRELEFSGYDASALAYRNRQANIFDGGNTFRYFDCSNLHSPMYNVQRVEEYGGEQFVLLRPEEDRSRKHFITETTLNGGMKVNVWDRENPTLEADYVWVNFSLPMAQPMLEGSVYIVGALTDWRLDSASRMDYNPTHKAYTKRMLLKQGYYAYLLLVTSGRLGRSATAKLEGDHRETHNRYTVYVYQKAPTDRAERLLAVTTVIN